MGRFRQAMGLIHHGCGLRAKRVLIGTPVVGAEEEISASRQDDSHIRLRLASVTAIRGLQGSGFGQRVHAGVSSRENATHAVAWR